MSDKPNCYKCKHRGTLPGNAHSKCVHPDGQALTIKASQHGINSGWFVWPHNFDPVWLQACDGFTESAPVAADPCAG